MSPFEKIIKDLKKGNKAYRTGNQNYSLEEKQEKWREGTEGQDPKVIILSCADSRVPPELIFNKSIGELFIMRVAGNIANSSSIASIEYAITYLNPQVIVVMGHEDCGAVKTAIGVMENPRNYTFHVDRLLNQIRPALQPDSLPISINNNIYKTISDLRNWSSVIAEAEKGEDGLKIVPVLYHMNGYAEFLPVREENTVS